jgi:cobalt-zinc-cadmium efflux system outer membrane protein
MIRVSLVVALLSGCTVSRTAGHREVAQVVADRIGAKTHWDQGSPDDAEVARVVDELLRQGLTRERAVEIALVNNRSLQATYEELGVSQADLVQAGLLKNPSFSGEIGFPIGAGSLELVGSLVWDFLQLFTLPLRKKVARQQFEADIQRVAHEALQTAAEVQKAYADVQAEEALIDFERSVAETMQGAALLSDRLYEAGNVNDLRHDTETALYQQALVDYDRELLRLANAREHLNRLLGLWGKQTGWKLATPLPDPPPQDPALDKLESLAIRQRLDVDAARKQEQLLTSAVALALNFRLFGTIEVGLQGHQDPDGPRVLGPQITLELPIFDQRQAAIAKLEAQRRMAERRLEGVSVDARSEVRAAAAALQSARKVVDRYHATLLPLRNRIVDESQLQFNGMLIGPFQLLTAKREQIEAHRGYVEALRDYWAARAELERAVGGKLK